MIDALPTPLPEALAWLSGFVVQTELLSIDYSRYFVIVLRNGYRHSIYGYFQVNRIWQNNSAVYVLAHFSDRRLVQNDPWLGQSELPAAHNQFQLIKIDRTQLVQPVTNFYLSDEAGYLRATTAVKITR